VAASTDAAKNFTLTGAPFSDGVNAFTLRVTDAAGNSTDVAYSVTVRSGAPVVEILENGVPLVAGTTFNRAVTPQVRVTPSDASVTAQLDSQLFTLGASVTSEATHNFSATATDPLGHSATASTTFTIDTHGPAVKIDTPAN